MRRGFLALHILQTSLFQLISDCMECKRLVGDFLEDINDLRGILSPPKGDQVSGIVNVSLKKL